ncbi:hypothetical protein [Shewanella chilikensis]|uniref:hypothetical protein n=1 Tax=Shewanella chilikensis TaxID=558541 RepID=UPI0039996BDE
MFVLTIEKQWPQPPGHSLNIHQASAKKAQENYDKRAIWFLCVCHRLVATVWQFGKTMTEQALNQH